MVKSWYIFNDAAYDRPVKRTAYRIALQLRVVAINLLHISIFLYFARCRLHFDVQRQSTTFRAVISDNRDTIELSKRIVFFFQAQK